MAQSVYSATGGPGGVGNAGAYGGPVSLSNREGDVGGLGRYMEYMSNADMRPVPGQVENTTWRPSNTLFSAWEGSVGVITRLQSYGIRQKSVINQVILPLRYTPYTKLKLDTRMSTPRVMPEVSEHAPTELIEVTTQSTWAELKRHAIAFQMSAELLMDAKTNIGSMENREKMRRCVESLVLRLEYDAVKELMRQQTLAQRWVSTRPVTANSASVRDYMEMRKSSYLAAGKCNTGIEHIFASVDLICNYLGNSLDTCVLPLGARQLERAIDTTIRKYTVENEDTIVKLGGARDKDYIEVNASGKFNVLTYAPVYDHVFGETMENPMFRVSATGSYFVMPRDTRTSTIAEFETAERELSNAKALDPATPNRADTINAAQVRRDAANDAMFQLHPEGIKIIDHNTHRYVQITPQDIANADLRLSITEKGDGITSLNQQTKKYRAGYEILVIRPFMLLGTGTAIFAKSGGAAGASWYKMTAIESGTDFSGGFQRVQCVAYTKCWIYDPSMVLTVPDCVPQSIKNGCGTRFMRQGTYDPYEMMADEQYGDLTCMMIDARVYRKNKDMPIALTKSAQDAFADYANILMNNTRDIKDIKSGTNPQANPVWGMIPSSSSPFNFDTLPVESNLSDRIPQILYPGHQLNPDSTGNHTISLPNTGFLGDLDSLDGSAVLQGIYQKRIDKKC